jgi:hypothetical protein
MSECPIAVAQAHAGHEVDDEAEGVAVAGRAQESDLFLGGDHGRARPVLGRAYVEGRVESYDAPPMRVLEDGLHSQEDLCLGRSSDVAAFHGGDETLDHGAVEGVHLPGADLRIGAGAHPGLGRGFRAARETAFAGEPCLGVLLEDHLTEGLLLLGDGLRSGLASHVQLGQPFDCSVLIGVAGPSVCFPRTLRKRMVYGCGQPDGLRHSQVLKKLPIPRASLFGMASSSDWSRPVNPALTCGYC